MAYRRLGTYTAEDQLLTYLAYTIEGTNAPTISTSFPKTGSRSFRSVNASLIGHFEEVPVSEIEMGMWVYLASTDMGDTLDFYSGGFSIEGGTVNSRIFIRVIPTSGQLVVRRPLNLSTYEELYTLEGIPVEFSTTGQYFHVGIRHKIDAVTGYLNFYVGGRLIFSYEGDTRPTHWDTVPVTDILVYSTTMSYMVGMGTVSGGNQGFGNAYIDDIYVNECAGESVRVPPLLRFDEKLVTAAGADAAFTPSAGSNFENVDEVPHDSDTTYNSAVAADLRDTFNFADFTLPANHAITRIIPKVFAKRLGSGELLSLHAYDGSTYLDSADLTPPSGYDRPIFADMPLQPDGTAWNETDLNAMQFGYRSRGTF